MEHRHRTPAPDRGGAAAMTSRCAGAARWPRAARPCLVGLLLLAVLALGGLAFEGGRIALDAAQEMGAPQGLADPRWLGLLLAYAALMAIPFVPGIELGLGLMLLLGRDGIVAVYLATQVALLLSFLCGRRLPGPAGDPAAALESRLWPCLRPAWRRLARHRHLGLALALNLPGNGAIGGAGGIALAVGASRAVGLPAFVLTVAVATSPLPLLLLAGWQT
jgi:hypothetical protein